MAGGLGVPGDIVKRRGRNVWHVALTSYGIRGGGAYGIRVTDGLTDLGCV